MLHNAPRRLLPAACVLLTAVAGVQAQTPKCDARSGEQAKLAADLLQSQYAYACCDASLAECLKQEPVCALVYRLAEDICRRVAEGQSRDEIVRGLSRRAKSMMPGGKEYDIELAGAPSTGAEDAPVVLVEYACARCPFCTKIPPPLVEAVRSGSLEGKVRLVFKTFPIRSHDFSKETGLGFVAAQRLGHFWEFMLHSYEHFDRFCIKKQGDWAEACGMDPEAFAELVADPEVRRELVESKKEGLRNDVDATPTFFINGRKYFGDLETEELIDVLEEEYDRVSGKKYRK